MKLKQQDCGADSLVVHLGQPGRYSLAQCMGRKRGTVALSNSVFLVKKIVSVVKLDQAGSVNRWPATRAES